MAGRREKPYWLPGSDDDICGLCDSPDATVMILRCTDCDEIICQFCVVETERGTFYCSECTPAGSRRR